ncbi:hypothetical protein [Geofilum rubicundum]|nr:hypothetical protein [Geofilum rubicundum]
MMSINTEKKIIVDADVIIHFSKGEQLFLLPQIFPNRLCILKDVFLEVFKGVLRTEIEKLLQMNFLEEIDFSSDIDVIKEYAKLKKMFGPGESACMAYCKFHQDVLASSNLKDIKQYCKDNGITYLTTMDFLNAAFEKQLLNENECDYFIFNVLSRGSKLPFKTLADYRKSVL